MNKTALTTDNAVLWLALFDNNVIHIPCFMQFGENSNEIKHHMCFRTITENNMTQE